ncbi:hypothetical protein [Actinoplanes sp. L3-i22]|uniref:hypothetical protein n=1 Tax=Actinoplanes sp. L3-i22 TaxID=2836373 RepID=UPI001C792008|nr:hypothetical protein [Actinoplanes sp. L3-i22]BCY08944.1 hypothetical protein L3i22_040320 [Actinoplanes sp. L3-i22]
MDIPVHLRHRPTSNGLVVPIATPRTPEGRFRFGLLADEHQRALLVEHRCQICGSPLGNRLILFARPADLRLACTSEPALCPPCAAYSTRACPMLAGRMARYRDRPSDDLRQRPADDWFAVWLADYRVVVHPARPQVLAASWLDHEPLTIRPIPPR